MELIGNLDTLSNRIHDLLHRPAEAVSAPTNLHLAFIVDETEGDIFEKAAEDNYARVVYAQGAPTDGESSNTADYVFPEPSIDYNIEGVALVEGNIIGAGTLWGVIMYDTPVTITSSNRTISAGNFTSIGVMVGDATIS